MSKRVENVNPKILKQCREQIGLSLSEVKSKVKKIAEIESGALKPTFKQLNVLAELYRVPRWVFIADKLPDEYSFEKSIPAFRQLADSNKTIFSEHKIRSLVAQIEQYRELIIELREDMDEPVEPFSPPKISENTSPVNAAKQIRKWLETEDHEFSEWKERLEEKGVFVFLTSKYKGWSNIDIKVFRGFAIYNEILPVIVINESDARRAKSFSLFHELGHLLMKQTDIDVWGRQDRESEVWCETFSGNLLLPANELIRSARNVVMDLDGVKSIAKIFKVSPYACLVRLRQENIINQEKYIELENELKSEYEQLRKKLEDIKGGPPRNRPKEIFEQYGRIYTTAVFQSYHNNEISLYKVLQLFGIKKPSYVFEMERML